MYSEKLIKEVKECYPDWEKVHKLADSGNPFLGRYLDDNSSYDMPLSCILEATRLDHLKGLARKEAKKRDCYNLWWEETYLDRLK